MPECQTSDRQCLFPNRQRVLNPIKADAHDVIPCVVGNAVATKPGLSPRRSKTQQKDRSSDCCVVNDGQPSADYSTRGYGASLPCAESLLKVQEAETLQLALSNPPYMLRTRMHDPDNANMASGALPHLLNHSSPASDKIANRKLDGSNLVFRMLMEPLTEFEPLKLATNALAEIQQHSRTYEKNHISAFSETYGQALSTLRRALDETTLRPLPTLLTILQLARIEVCGPTRGSKLEANFCDRNVSLTGAACSSTSVQPAI